MDKISNDVFNAGIQAVQATLYLNNQFKYNKKAQKIISDVRSVIYQILESNLIISNNDIFKNSRLTKDKNDLKNLNEIISGIKDIFTAYEGSYINKFSNYKKGSGRFIEKDGLELLSTNIKLIETNNSATTYKLANNSYFSSVDKLTAQKWTHIFSSVVRNSSPLSTLMKLGFETTAAMSAESYFKANYSTRDGKIQLQDKISAMTDVIPEVKKSLRKINPTKEVITQKSNDVSISFSIDVLKLISTNENLKKQYDLCSNINKSQLNTLITNYSQQVNIKEISQTSIMSEIENRRNEFIKKLDDLNKECLKQSQKIETERKKKAEEDALKALAGLGSHLKVLKKNPELLQSVFENLSP